MSTQPGVAEMQAFARECLAEATELRDQSRMGLEAMIDGLGAMVESSDASAAIKETNTIIEDVTTFKAKLRYLKAI